MFKNAQLELRINKLLKVDRDETVHRVKYRPKQSIRNAGFSFPYSAKELFNPFQANVPYLYPLKTSENKTFSGDIHCVKSVHIRSYSGPYFPAFGLNAERYSLCSLNAVKYGPK